MITGAEVEVIWEVIGKIGVAVGIVVALIKGFQYLNSLMPVSKLEARIVKVEEHDKNDFEKLKNIELRLDNVETKLKESDNKINRIDEGIQRLGKSQILLLRHFATGNGQKEMAEEAEDLTEYFIERR